MVLSSGGNPQNDINRFIDVLASGFYPDVIVLGSDTFVSGISGRELSSPLDRPIIGPPFGVR